MNETNIKAIRGAVCCTNEKTEIIQKTIELYDKLLTANCITEEDILSLFFSVTADINAINPASALRQSGRAVDAAMMVFQEAAVLDSMPGTIRILIHAHMAAKKIVQHVYIHGAEVLRPDRG